MQFRLYELVNGLGASEQPIFESGWPLCPPKNDRMMLGPHSRSMATRNSSKWEPYRQGAHGKFHDKTPFGQAAGVQLTVLNYGQLQNSLKTPAL